MVSRRELAAIWAGSTIYTAYVVALAFLAPALLGTVAGVIVALVLSLGPVIGLSFWMLRPGPRW